MAAKPAANLGRAVASFAKPRLGAGDDVPAQLRARGLEPRDIKLVVMTHLHFDHTSAMSEFPGSTFGVPANGLRNQQIVEAKGSPSTKVWLNYANVKGTWTSA